MALTITACCALHNFCLDNADNAANIPESVVIDFESDIQQFNSNVREEDDDEDEDVEVVLSAMEPLVTNGYPVVSDDSLWNNNRLPDQIHAAHVRSQERGRQVRERMADSLAPLSNTEIRRHLAEVREQERQRTRQRILNDRARERSRRRRNIRRNQQ
jgi:hypothetical protein